MRVLGQTSAQLRRSQCRPPHRRSRPRCPWRESDRPDVHGGWSGDWLYRALYKAGVANIAKVDSIQDGLVLTGVLITAVAHCAPPDNKPLPSEIANCRTFFDRTLALRKWKAILCLRSMHDSYTSSPRREKPPFRPRKSRNPNERAENHGELSPESAEHIHRQANRTHAGLRDRGILGLRA